MGIARRVTTTPKEDEGIETEIELATGAIAGAAAGAMAGPIGAIVGAGVGTAAAVLAHEALARGDEAARERDREPDPAAHLRGDHDELEGMAKRALAIVAEGESEEVRALIARIDHRLGEHMEGEELELLPQYAEEHPDDAAAIRAEHAGFRRIFDELAVAGDLHLVRLERVKELLDALRAHAKHENVGLYRWAASRGERV